MIEKFSMKKQFYSWDIFHTYTLHITRQVVEPPDVVISIGKGGSVPGVILASRFGVNNLNLGLKSYNKKSRGEIVVYQPLSNFDSLRDQNILLVDDIADSGSTLVYASELLSENFCSNVRTATVFYKPSSVFKPDIYGIEVETEEWIVLPWENSVERAL